MIFYILKLFKYGPYKDAYLSLHFGVHFGDSGSKELKILVAGRFSIFNIK